MENVTIVVTMIISTFIAIAAWFTHIIVCIQYGLWVLMLFGILVPPIGWVHGIGTWFGAFSHV